MFKKTSLKIKTYDKFGVCMNFLADSNVKFKCRQAFNAFCLQYVIQNIRLNHNFKSQHVGSLCIN